MAAQACLPPTERSTQPKAFLGGSELGLLCASLTAPVGGHLALPDWRWPMRSEGPQMTWTPTFESLCCLPTPWPSDSQEEHLRTLVLLGAQFYGMESVMSAMPTSRWGQDCRLQQRKVDVKTVSKPNSEEGSPAGGCLLFRGVRRGLTDGTTNWFPSLTNRWPWTWGPQSLLLCAAVGA